MKRRTAAEGPGPKSRALAKRAKAVLFGNYGERDIAFVRGEGTTLWDADGRRYLDFLGGIAVTALGHSHPAVTKAIRAQAGKLLHTSNLYLIEPQVQLAEELVKRSFADRAFFCNSGTEAIEALIKLARRWGSEKDAKRHEIIVASNAFHGRTLGALSATPNPKYREGFGPLVPGFRIANYGDPDDFRAQVTGETCAILVEPIQGEGGVHVAQSTFLQGLRQLCDEHGLLLLFDEIQVGMGRTGKLFAYESFDVVPDALALAKALGNGVPVGAVLARDEVAALLGPGLHGTTFGGNFLASAAARATVREIAKKSTLKNVEKQGTRLRNGLEELAARFPGKIRAIRGMGLLAGIELDEPPVELLKAARNRGLVVGTAAGNVVRFAPPLTVSAGEVDEALGILGDAMESLWS